MNKEYHLWLDIDTMVNECPVGKIALSFKIFQENRNADIIHTTLPCTLSTDLFEKGYKIFIHDLQGDKIEIKLGKNECTTREIRLGHNLEKLLFAGEFCDIENKGDD